jgi:hypothetical protein
MMHYSKHVAGQSYSEIAPHQYFCYNSKFEWQRIIYLILHENSNY